MEIKWLGHSCFKIKGKNTTIITDPFPPEAGATLNKVSGDIVTVSHQHAAHSNVAAIGGQPRIIKGPGEYEIGDAIIIGITSYHDDSKGTQRGQNTVYLIQMDELSICHLGDLGHTLEDSQMEELGIVDVLILPVGGGTTIDASMASEIIRQLEPKAVIPMHYKGTAEDELPPEIDKFLKEIGLNNILPQPKLVISKTSLPLTTQVFILQH